MLVLKSLLLAEVRVERRCEVRRPLQNSTSITSDNEATVGGIVFVGSASAGLASANDIEIRPESATT